MVVLAGILASSVGSALRAQTSGPASVAWLVVSIVGAVLAGMTVLVTGIVRGRRDLTVRQSQRVAYDDALDPLVQSLAKLVDLDEGRRAAARGEFVRQVLVSACQLLSRDGSRVRASYYAAEAGEEEPIWRSVQSTGRSGAPTTTFTAGTAAGDAVVTMLREGSPRLCRDTRLDPPPGWEPAGEHDYRTFITVPARTKAPGDRDPASYGFLTVDAPEPGDLTHDDVPLVRLLATLLAVATVVDVTLAEREGASVSEVVDLRGRRGDERGDADDRGAGQAAGAPPPGTGPRHRLRGPLRADDERP